MALVVYVCSIQTGRLIFRLRILVPCVKSKRDSGDQSSNLLYNLTLRAAGYHPRLLKYWDETDLSGDCYYRCVSRAESLRSDLQPSALIVSVFINYHYRTGNVPLFRHSGNKMGGEFYVHPFSPGLSFPNSCLRNKFPFRVPVQTSAYQSVSKAMQVPSKAGPTDLILPLVRPIFLFVKLPFRRSISFFGLPAVDVLNFINIRSKTCSTTGLTRIVRTISGPWTGCALPGGVVLTHGSIWGWIALLVKALTDFAI